MGAGTRDSHQRQRSAAASGNSASIQRRRAAAEGYVAQPNGRSGTEFRLTKLEGQHAVFENPQHDHPKLFRYMITEDGRLRIEIEGDEGASSFHLEPAPKP